MRFGEIKNDLPKRSMLFELAVAILIAALCVIGALESKKYFAPMGGPFGRWRKALVARADAIFDPPVSAWVAGLLLGADQGFSRDWKKAFKRTGTSHLTAVSGYNVGVVLNGMQFLLLRLPISRRLRSFFALGCVAGFVLLTGAPGSVLRSAFMIAAVEAGRHLGRPVKPLRALLLAAAIIGLFSPASLVADRGLQLSILSSFGLVTLSPVFASLIPKRMPKTLAGWICQTLAASVATAPLIAWMAGTYSLVTLPANLAVAAFIPPLMAGGAFVMTVGFISMPLARALAAFGNLFFATPLAIIWTMASWRAASISGPAAFAVLVAVETVAIVLLLRWRRKISRAYAIHE